MKVFPLFQATLPWDETADMLIKNITSQFADNTKVSHVVDSEDPNEFQKGLDKWHSSMWKKCRVLLLKNENNLGIYKAGDVELDHTERHGSHGQQKPEAKTAMPKHVQ